MEQIKEVVASGSPTDHPPLPCLAFSIGVVGHRPRRLAGADPAAIESEVRRVLDMIEHEVRVVHQRYAEYFTKERPQLTLVSALAEGADRIVAQAARDKGFALDVPIPFTKEIYEQDFTAEATQENSAASPPQRDAETNSLATFKALIAEKVARSVLELPGKRRSPRSANDQDADKAYEMAGLTVIAQADILLTIWDGGNSGGLGGTADMLQEAVRRGVPIIEINVAGGDAGSANHETSIHWSSLRESPIVAEQIEDLPSERFDDVLPRLIEEFLRPPSADSEREALRHYLDIRPQVTGIWCWVAGWRSSLTRARREKRSTRAASRAEAYSGLMRRISTDGAGARRTRLGTVFGWADVMAIGFARSFRFAVIFNFLIAALAVIAALTSLLTQSNWPVGIEIFLILVVLGNTIVGRKLRWHMRWMEAREVAERMRVAILFWILGAQPRAFFGEEPAWTGWYARAIVREQGMRPGHLNRDGMSDARAAMLDVLEDQHNYHRKNARKMRRRENWLEWVGLVFFGGTLLVAAIHIWGHGPLVLLLHGDDKLREALVMLSAILPALATASYGIRIIGDYEGIAKRSERTEANLHRVLEALRRDPANLILFRARAQVVADAMLGDVSSWRLAAESRDLAIPG
jgi:hypothetical protein